MSFSHDGTRAILLSALTHSLFGMGFRNVRILGRRDDGDATEAAPDVIARASSGRVDAFAITTAQALETAEEAERLRAIAAEADEKGSTIWVVVPQDEQATAEALLRKWSLPARLIGV